MQNQDLNLQPKTVTTSVLLACQPYTFNNQLLSNSNHRIPPLNIIGYERQMAGKSIKIVKEGKIFRGQEPPCGEYTTTECGLS